MRLVRQLEYDKLQQLKGDKLGQLEYDNSDN